MLEQYKQKYIEKLKSYEKRTILFINGHDEYDFEKLNEMSLRKIMYTNWTLSHNYTNNHVRESFAWEEEWPIHQMDPNWHFKEKSEELKLPNYLEEYEKNMYKLLAAYEGYEEFRKIICPEKRREDLDKYFHVKETEYNSKVMVYEASSKHLFTMIIYVDPFWFDNTHVAVRIASEKSLYKDDNIRLGAEMYGMEEWLRYNIELNTPKEQEMLKQYKYSTMLYISYQPSGTHSLFSADVNDNIVIK